MAQAFCDQNCWSGGQPKIVHDTTIIYLALVEEVQPCYPTKVVTLRGGGKPHSEHLVTINVVKQPVDHVVVLHMVQ